MKLSLIAIVAATSGFVGCQGEPPAPPPPPPVAAPAAEPVEQEKYQSLDTVADAGKVSGTISYAGKQIDTKVKITKQPEVCCAKCKEQEHAAQTLVVNKGKLANAVIYIPDIAKGKKYDKTTAVVDNSGCAFAPHVGIGFKGGMVQAKNDDPVLHNTHLKLMDGNKELGNIALPDKGQMVEKPIKKAGPISVTCDAHEWMQAYLFVAENPYVTVSGNDGKFTLTDVPPGEYTVKVWHERLGEKTAKVTVPAKGEAKLDVKFSDES